MKERQVKCYDFTLYTRRGVIEGEYYLNVTYSKTKCNLLVLVMISYLFSQYFVAKHRLIIANCIVIISVLLRQRPPWRVTVNDLLCKLISCSGARVSARRILHYMYQAGSSSSLFFRSYFSSRKSRKVNALLCDPSRKMWFQQFRIYQVSNQQPIIST